MATSQCEALSRRRLFIEAAGSTPWPYGTVSGLYAFRHALYRDALYQDIPQRRATGERWHAAKIVQLMISGG